MICRYRIVTNIRSIEVTSDGEPSFFTNTRGGVQGNRALGWVGKNELETVFGAYTNYCAYPNETISSITRIECETPPVVQYDCINGACIPKTTFGTEGKYNSLAECQSNCGSSTNSCTAPNICVPPDYCPPGMVCIPSEKWGQIEGLSSDVKNISC